MQSRIRFHYLVKPFFFPKRNIIKIFIKNRLRKKGKAVEAINYIFCSDAYLLELNKRHLNHNTFTDIITFELSEKNSPLIADIYISIDRVKENAAMFKSGFSNELHRVIFHGALHLAGYRDKSKKEAIVMRTMEDEWLKSYRST
jgi:probable rRNA maturation factor